MSVVVRLQPIGDVIHTWDHQLPEVPQPGDRLHILDAPAGFPGTVNWTVKGRSWQIYRGDFPSAPDAILYIEPTP